MRSTPRLLTAEVIAHCVVRVRFEDGTMGDVDLSYLVGRGPVFAPLADPTYFARVRVDREGNTIVWPDGADIAPETLYERALGARLAPN